MTKDEKEEIKKNIANVFAERRDKKERKEWEDTFQEIKVPNSMIPKGVRLMECYLDKNQIIVCDDVDSEDETHNCDQMGCSTFSHVKYRFNINDSRQFR